MGIDLLLRRRMMFGEDGFSVSPFGKVMFSTGNLQYQSSNSVWSFADYQWSMGGTFAYGTSGYNNGQTCYMPTSTSTDPNDYYSGDLVGTADWGYNQISNGGNSTNLWRTLSKDEWSYLLFTRQTESGFRFVKCCLTWLNCQGVIVFPDEYDNNLSIQSMNNKSAAFTSYSVASASDWSTNFGGKGCVFLVTNYTSGNGWYWTASYGTAGSGDSVHGGYNVAIFERDIDIGIHLPSDSNQYAIGNNTASRIFVRLVQDC